MLKAVMFDMDGVLIDTEPVYMERIIATFKKMGITLNPEDLFPLAGASREYTLRFLQRIWPAKVTFEDIDNAFSTYFEDNPLDYSKILNPHVPEILAYLKEEKRLPIALCSSSPMDTIQLVVSQCGIKQFFTHIVSGEMFRESKPNPEIYLHTLGLIGCKAEEALAIEDSDYGIQAAKSAGLYVIGKRDTRYGYTQTLADCLIDDLIEIKAVIHQLMQHT